MGYIIFLSVYLLLHLHFLSCTIKLHPFLLMDLSPAFVQPAVLFSVFIKTTSISTKLSRCLICSEADLEAMSYFCLLAGAQVLFSCNGRKRGWPVSWSCTNHVSVPGWNFPDVVGELSLEIPCLVCIFGSSIAQSEGLLYYKPEGF